jgi:hypothetical protein
MKPNPGSDDAIKGGCKCPVYDNARGRGAWGSSGKDAIFWIATNCPMHGKARRGEKKSVPR